jgi:hypothetical protein
LIGARLAVADRCVTREQLLPRVRRSMCGWVSRASRLRNRHGSVDQSQQRYRRDQLSHVGFPELAPLTMMVTGSSITRCGKPHVLFRAELDANARKHRWPTPLATSAPWRVPVWRHALAAIKPTILLGGRGPWGVWVWVICLTLRRASGTEHYHPQSGRFRARSQSPSSVAYRLRKLATPIALAPRGLP